MELTQLYETQILNLDFKNNRRIKKSINNIFVVPEGKTMNEVVLISLKKEELENIIKEAVSQALNTDKEKELMNFKETCEFLGISSSALNKWKSENRIPYKKLGKRIFFNRQEVLDALKDSNYYKLRDLN